MGPSHTPVFWNGLNIQSPMNGTTDASLLSIWPGDRLELRYGGQSAAQSSGAMGGSILIEPDCSGNRGVSGMLGGHAGSFGYRQGMAGVGWGNASIQGAFRGQTQSADNDFPFRNTTLQGQPVVRQPNNGLNFWDIEQLNRLVIGDRHIIKTAFWTLGAYREIPPLMTAIPKDTWQRDAATRAAVSWEYSPGVHTLLITKAAWQSEQIVFHLPGITDSSRSRTAMFSAEFSTLVARHLVIRAGGSELVQQARASGYSETARWYHQARLAAFGSAEWIGREWSVSVLLRQEWAIGEARPFTWSVGGQYNAGKAGRLHGHLSHNFNLPTFNDRYWKAWGNPNLRPEKGLSADAGWSIPGKTLSVDATVFHILSDDWILWQPGPDGIFRPGNLRKVWSRGLEMSASLKGRTGSWDYRADARYQLVHTTNVAVYTADLFALNKQLTYVPGQTAGITARISRNRFSAAYLHQWTGTRYTTSDNARSLPGYQTGNFLLQYTWKLSHKVSIAIDARINNCWNAAWQFFEFQPMAGRSWHGGVGVRF
jgi:iron complex outermembrane receptor protein